MKFAISAPKMQWFKAESAAFMAVLTQFVLVWFGYDISWLQGGIVTLATFAGAFVTVKPA